MTEQRSPSIDGEGLPASGAPPKLVAAWGGLAVSLAAAALKFLAFRDSGSVALYSDALESLVNIAGAGAAFVALSLSRRPPDADYPYGYQKAEHLSAIVEALMVLAAAATILCEAYDALREPRILSAPWRGLALNGLGTALNAGWGWWLLAAGRRWKSPAALASGRHLLTDVLTSAGVIVGLVLVLATGWAWLDPLVAALVAAEIAVTGFAMVGEALDGLMDRADRAAARRIADLFAAFGEGAVEARAIRTRRAGARLFAEFELSGPADMSVGEARRICDRVETSLRAEFGETVVAFHLAPANPAPRPEGWRALKLPAMKTGEIV